MGLQLQYDILLSIAEKIVFSSDNEFRLDLRDIKALNFMLVNKACMNSFFFQLKRMKKVFLSSGGFELRSLVPIEGRNYTLDQPKFFQGPFNVNDWLFLLLLQQGLRLKFVEVFYVLTDARSIFLKTEEINRICFVKGETSFESFIKLLLFKNSPHSFEKIILSDFKSLVLELDCVKFTENSNVFSNLDQILNLNSNEVWIESVGAFSEYSVIKTQRIKANRTKHCSLIYSVDINDPMKDTKDFPFTHLKSVLVAILDSCPNLERIYVRFGLVGEFSYNDFVILSNWLQNIIKKLASDILLEIECHSELIVAFHAFFPESALLDANQKAHELTQLGEKNLVKTDEDCIGEGDEDGISSIISTDELSPSFTISRLLNIDEKRMKKISYSLIGVHEDNTQDDEWQGFNGPVVMNQPSARIE